MPLKFQNPKWRFKSPGPLERATVDGFLRLIDAIGEQGEPKSVYEVFKDLFNGSTTPSSSSASYARYDLEQLMREAAANAPRFIVAFLSGCDARASHGEDVPDLDIVNDLLSEHEAGYQVIGDTLVATGDGGEAESAADDHSSKVISPPTGTLTVKGHGATVAVEPPPTLQIFLCHSTGDKPAVRALYDRLAADGFTPWLDEEDLIAGERWDSVIQKAVRKSHVVAVCLSRSSVAKTGYLQKEITVALDAADYRPEGTIYVVPVRLEECDVPERLAHIHYVDLFKPDGYERLLKSLNAARSSIA